MTKPIFTPYKRYISWKPILPAVIQRTTAQSLVFRSYMAMPNQIFRKRFFMITVGESKNNNQQKIWIANRIELQKISDFIRYCFACFSLSFCTFGTEIVISIFNVRKGMPSQNSTDLLVVKRDLNRCVQSNSRFETKQYFAKEDSVSVSKGYLWL